MCSDFCLPPVDGFGEYTGLHTAGFPKERSKSFTEYVWAFLVCITILIDADRI